MHSSLGSKNIIIIIITKIRGPQIQATVQLGGWVAVLSTSVTGSPSRG